MINEVIDALAPTSQKQLMYAFNECIAQHIILPKRVIEELKLEDKQYYIGCYIQPNPDCFQPIEQSGDWSFGIYKGCICS